MRWTLGTSIVLFVSCHLGAALTPTTLKYAVRHAGRADGMRMMASDGRGGAAWLEKDEVESSSTGTGGPQLLWAKVGAGW